ncbi:HD domain-containing phosphohydrolase [Blastopirellula marina]|uniref:Two-component system response regulator n=1 Tax=Blastopirellula marina TaxID=124 RepID=A0A2S8F968_9BACT|nr:HD domain-containing phosphohydrolase [Blastopirellula marina]PQO28685.1 two-component system response regulator [Blastopirellula marina]PTL41958.1 two-component system response regulator [Blastopirellula marina]
MIKRVLLVDDEPNILNGYKRHLRKQFEVEVAEGGGQAIQRLDSDEAYAVVVSDMQMPGVSGVQVLAHAARLHPDTVRVMLTGNADQQTAVVAVNEGRIFRFLNKPCQPDLLAQTLEEGLRQYQLLRTEHNLLSKTLGGSVSLMTEVLSLVNPLAFGSSSRIRHLTRKICAHLSITNAWEVEAAAMLSKIGCVSVPQQTLEKWYGAKPLTPDEQQMIDAHPLVGASLVRKIPRLNGVAKIIERQNCRLDRPCQGDSPDEEIPLGARVLKVLVDYDALISTASAKKAIEVLANQRKTWYDATVVAALVEILQESEVIRMLSIAELKFGMLFDQDVKTNDGSILVTKGQEVNESIIRRLQNFERSQGVQQPIAVRELCGESASEPVAS